MSEILKMGLFLLAWIVVELIAIRVMIIKFSEPDASGEERPEERECSAPSDLLDNDPYYD